MRAKRAGPFSPVHERLHLALPRVARQHAVGGELLAPFLERRELGNRGLPGSNDIRRSAGQQPFGKALAATGGGRGTKPLEERRPAEQIQVQRIRVMDDVERRGSIPRRKILPAPLEPGARMLAGHPQGLVPRRTLLDARMPYDEPAEDREEPGSPAARHGSAPRATIQATERDGQEKHRQPDPRYAHRSLPFGVAVGGVLPRARLVLRAHELRFLAPMLSRQ